MTGERHRSLFRSAIAPVIVLAGFLAAVGCDRPPASHAVEGEARPPSVQRIHPERQTLRQTFEQPASVAAFQETPIFAKIAGYVRKVHKDIGDHVKAGEILAELSVPEMVEEVHRKEALVQQAEAGVEQARKALAATEASLQSARAQVKEAEAGKARAQANVDRSRAQFKRYQGATTGGVIDRDALDEARFQQEAAQAALQEIEAKVHSAEALLHEAQARRDRAQADVAASRAQVQVAVADRNQYQALLSYAKVTAPFDGVLTARAVDEGHLLQPAASGAKGEPLFVIMQVDPVRVFLDVPETDAALVHTGMPAQVRLQALPGLEVPGR